MSHTRRRPRVRRDLDRDLITALESSTQLWSGNVAAPALPGPADPPFAPVRRAGRRAAARSPLREALDLAARGGATALASSARTELLASGARPRRDVLRGRDALTASERRIAMLAAEGRSNREIAQALFVTVRAVETHLTHVYSKLGFERRELLAAAL